ncbi:unnamed protein product [Meloidogyne enterolobii]|uniref:Uncharacterized protein n=1 Tax=Meloidogyne enterolobii TaxID=390850 RepID=A0ACB0ZLT7_MELEN
MALKTFPRVKTKPDCKKTLQSKTKRRKRRSQILFNIAHEEIINNKLL